MQKAAPEIRPSYPDDGDGRHKRSPTEVVNALTDRCRTVGDISRWHNLVAHQPDDEEAPE